MASGYASLHVLDGYHGRPGGGMTVDLHREVDGAWQHVKTLKTLPNGRSDGPLLSEDEYETGRYQVLLHIGDYFAEHGARTSEPPYLTVVPLHLNFAELEGHYHVPVTVSPWGYTHFRGSA
jgi:5-hydroxyisourate hydrolase